MRLLQSAKITNPKFMIGLCLIGSIAGFAIGYYFPHQEAQPGPRVSVFQPSGVPYCTGGCGPSDAIGSIAWSGSLINAGSNGYAVVDFKFNNKLADQNTYYVEASKQVSVSHISQIISTIGWFHSLPNDTYSIVIERQSVTSP
jgi:hypothetical protein